MTGPGGWIATARTGSGGGVKKVPGRKNGSGPGRNKGGRRRAPGGG